MTLQHNSPPVMGSDTASPSPGPPDPGPPDPRQLNDDIIRVTRELRGLAHDHIELVALETRLAVDTTLRMVILAVFTAIVLVSAWLALVGAAALGLIAIGLAPGFAMLLLGAANVLLGLFGWLRMRQKLRSLGWPATQRLVEPPAATEQREGVA
jgi:hypothetical protein